jgi:outer membrane receptor for ferrienterochelin and colicins
MVCLESELLVRTYRNCKGPASSLYGSEAVGGLININQNPKNAPFFSRCLSTDWGEVNVDIGFKANVGKAASVLTGINYLITATPSTITKTTYRLNLAG